MSVNAVRGGMLVQIIAGGPPVRVESVRRVTHNGRPCQLITGTEYPGPGPGTRVEVYVSDGHEVTPWPEGAVAVIAS